MSIIADALKKAQRKGKAPLEAPPPFDLGKEGRPAAAEKSGAAAQAVAAPPKAKPAPVAQGPAPKAVPVTKGAKKAAAGARRWDVRRLPLVVVTVLVVFAAVIAFIYKVYLPDLHRGGIKGPALPIAAPVAQQAVEQPPQTAGTVQQPDQATPEAAEPVAGKLAAQPAQPAAGGKTANRVEPARPAGRTAAVAEAATPEPAVVTETTEPEPAAEEPVTDVTPAEQIPAVTGPPPAGPRPTEPGTGIVRRDAGEKGLPEDIYHFNMAVFYQRRGDIKSALAEYAEVIRLSPNNREVYSNMGVLYNQIGEYDNAVSVLQKALLVDPNYSKARNNLGLAYYRSGHYDQALEQLNRALALEPANPEAYNNLGLVYRRMNEFDLAELGFRKALVVNPDYAPAHYNLALLYEDNGNLEEARSHYRAFLVSPGADPETASRVERRLQELTRNQPPGPSSGN
ncbi:MAG: tetratricopeptide repeat protein [Candidatus Glassbacteria bacterium]